MGLIYNYNILTKQFFTVFDTTFSKANFVPYVIGEPPTAMASNETVVEKNSDKTEMFGQ